MSKSLHADSMERFIDNIDVLDNGCWQWRRSLATFGYGKFTIRQSQYMAHRFSYELYVGEVPEGKQLDHLCRNRGCVNPEHLEPVTIKENVLRGVGLAAINAKSSKCPKEHVYSGTNSRGDRICKPCAKLADHKFKRRVEAL